MTRLESQMSGDGARGFSRAKVDWRRAVRLTHRWLGTGGCLFFIAWFVSGIVMMYARMPELSASERFAALPPLDLSSARLSPADALARIDGAVSTIRVGMLAGRPVYRALADRAWVTVFADSGERFERLSSDGALEEAKRFAPAFASGARYDGRLTEPDQWTLAHVRSLPMHRVALGTSDDERLYFAERTGEVVLKTTAPARRIAYAGAVLHWFYFTPFRRHHELWTQTFVGLSALGTLMCFLGLVWGFYNCVRFPYRGWLRWHHFIGLVFGVVSFTWILSGLLSLDPLDWHADTEPTPAQRSAFSGGALKVGEVSLAQIKAELPAGAKELEVVPFRGKPRLLFDGTAREPIDRPDIDAALALAMPGVAPADVTTLTDYDSYYYDRDRLLPLPVIRARYQDASATWLYVDPGRGAIVRKEERSSRVNRWLYHGLHSLDFPALYWRRPLWDIVMILLLLGGLGSAVTAVAPASRRVWRNLHRLL
jgi:hypothetical protein